MRTVEEAARGIVTVANTAMARALRVVSVERGFDPADFTLVAFGGAGPLHACELAEALRMPRVLVPRHPGVLSAMGMIWADAMRDYSTPAHGNPAIRTETRPSSRSRVAKPRSTASKHVRATSSAPTRCSSLRWTCATPGKATSSPCRGARTASRSCCRASTTSIGAATATRTPHARSRSSPCACVRASRVQRRRRSASKPGTADASSAIAGRRRLASDMGRQRCARLRPRAPARRQRLRRPRARLPAR